MRKSRVDSDSQQIASLQAKSVISPPDSVKLSPQEHKHFLEVTSEYAKAELNPTKLAICVMLARTLASIEKQEKLVDKEGMVIPGLRGPVVNPRVRVVRSLVSEVVKLRSHLLSDGRQRAVQKETRLTAKRMEEEAETTISASANLIQTSLPTGNGIRP